MIRLRSVVALPLLAACATFAACSSDPPAAPALADQLESDTGTKWAVYVDPASKEVRFLAPTTPVRIGTGTNEEDARAFFDRYRDQLHGTGKGDELRMVEAVASEDGTTHLRFEHFLPGTTLPVFDVTSTAHFTADGAAYWLRPGFRADLGAIDPVAKLSEADAVRAATADVAATCGAIDGTPAIEGTELGVRADDGQPAALAYRVRVRVNGQRCVLPEILVDAASGAVLDRHENVRSAWDHAPGARFHLLDDKADMKWIDVNVPFVGKDTLKSQTKPFVETRALVKKDDIEDIQKSDSGVWDENQSYKGVGVSAHFHGFHALRFFKEARLCGCDDSKGPCDDKTRRACANQQIVIHDRTARTDGGNNASNVKGIVYLGDGDVLTGGNQMPGAAAFDVVAHEITHGITMATSKLRTELESGALDESFSDVMGASAEEWFNETNDKTNPKMRNLVFGELWTKDGSGKRDMVDPGSKRHDDDTHNHKEVDPDHTKNAVRCRDGELPNDKTSDGCFVHRNAGIPNRAFSLMTIGGTNKTSKMSVAKGIGWETARGIWFKSITSLSPQSTFTEAGLAQIAEAARLSPDALQAVGCAWLAVGVFAVDRLIDPRLALLTCPAPGAAPPAPSGPPAAASGCAGRGDAIVCDQNATASAYVCKNGGIIGTALCADLAQHCKQASATDTTGTIVDGQLVCE